MEQIFTETLDMLNFIPTNNKCKKKLKTENEEISNQKKVGGKRGQQLISDCFKTQKRKHDRFNGIPEEELYKRCLPDHLVPNLDILIIGINPGLFAASRGHHYAGPGNHFWKCLYLSGLTPEPMTALDDFKLIQYGIGFTNIVQRTTRGSADLKPQEIKEGAKILLEKIKNYQPKIAVFNGKEIYRIFSGKKDFGFGRQPVPIEGTQTLVYVMPSSSARCSQLPRAVDKVPFYVALRKLREHVCGRLPDLSEREVTFSSVLVTAKRKNDPNNNNPTVPVKMELMDCKVKLEMMDYKVNGGLTGDDDDLRSSINGIDDDGRPTILGPNSAFNVSLIKKEIFDNDDKQDDDRMSSGNAVLLTAREKSSDLTELSSILDKSTAFLLDLNYSDIPTNGSPSNVGNNNGLTIFQPNLLHSQFFPSRSTNAILSAVETVGNTNGSNNNNFNKPNDIPTKNIVGPSDGDDDNNQGGNQQPYQNGGKNDPPTNNGGQMLSNDSAGSLINSQVPNTVQQQSTNHNLLGLIDHQQIAHLQQINGGGQSSPSSVMSPIKTEIKTEQPVRQTPVHVPKPCNLPPEIEHHVEQAIETVVQRARDGPLDMPAFRTPAEKSAAAHAHQQQQQQQQLLANFQLQAAAAAAAATAAQFDLRTMKSNSSSTTGGVPAASLIGNSNYEQSCQSANSSAANAAVAAAAAAASSPNLYSQYFQQPQANQFGAGAAAYGTPQWAFTTATTGVNNAAVMYNHPSTNMMTVAAAPYFQNAAFSNQQLYHQSGVGTAANSTGGGAVGAGTLPFSPTAASSYFNQQQAAAAAALQQQQSMYGNYAAASGFNMQQGSHNL